jgi:hypothetical protein
LSDEFSNNVKAALAARVGYLCSNPSCRALTSGPQENPAKAVNLGVAAHITAASPGGPRYDTALLPDARSAASNGIWLCQNCAKLIDNDPGRFTVEGIRKWKIDAEEEAKTRIGKTAPTIESQCTRRLSDWQKVKLVASLSRYANQKAVILASAGTDTQVYAENLRKVLESAGWKVRGPLSAPPSVPVVDVQVSVSGKYFAERPPEPYLTLRGTLEFVGVRCRDRLILDPAVPDDVAVVWVGGEGNLPPSSLPPLAVEGLSLPDF